MVNSMVARATNNMLMGPDWAMNLEICDVCNRDPVQAKDVVKGIKKRLGSRNPKSQLLALTLLESVVKNCGDVVHLNVAERNLLHDMIKIVKKKKPDYHVKEKILILIDTWQEAFGGERGRYPQYYVAYLELLRLGVTFPEKSAREGPVLTPPQTHPITSVPYNPQHPENENETRVHTAEADFPTLSLTEMQNARGVMDVLAEMLTAVDPTKKEGLRQEVVVDLVEQCRTYKRRLVHLVNSTSDESLLSLGLALNDDLQRVLAKHEALLTTTHVVSSEKSNAEKSTPETSRAIVPVTTPLGATDTKQVGSTSGAADQPDLISLAPATTNGQSTSSAIVNFDLLSGDDFDTSTASNALAIVPVGETQPATPVSQQNALALVSVLSPQTQQPRNMSARQTSFYQNRNVAQNQSWAPNNQGNNPFGVTMNNGLPPAPWEAPHADNQLVVAGSMQYSQPHGIQTPGNINMNINNQMGQQIYPQQMGQQMYPQQMGQQMYPQQLGQQMYTNQMGQQVYGNQVGQQMYGNQMGQQAYGNQMGQQVYGNQMGQQMYGNQMGQQMYGNQMGQQMYGNQMGQQMYGNQMGQQQMYNSQMGQQMYNNQMGQAYGYGPISVYGQQQNGQYIGKSMPGMPVRDDNFLTSTVYTGPSMANASYVHVSKTQKSEDKLFGDLVDFSKVKPKKMTPGIGERV
ncbi:putative target of Myb protein [Helianthus annuus]|uniref:Target of Myb protein n=1 Tax=Helianthus annuus TaxID=4232 RepID=A0A9K3HTF2_HELAN|nr:TOM1-like protein 9 [Helianthus annuus]KAF5784217.1 putative target of Myb protein [Helianthus annuus]KAJ0511767.1 putative VHS domain, GAT domain, GAT domain superfamily protein [Helianthus annuus]KAJ0519389.1 putative TOM1-like protein, plant [Helianthus annuus]